MVLASLDAADSIRTAFRRNPLRRLDSVRIRRAGLVGDLLTEVAEFGDGLLEPVPRRTGMVIARGVNVSGTQANFRCGICACVLQQAR